MKLNVPFEQKWKKIPTVGTLLNICGLGKYTCRGANERRRLRTMAKKYTLRNDELYYRDTDGELKLCLAQSEVPAVLTEFHESSFGGHWERDVTISNLHRHFYSPTMRKDVTEHLKRCEAC